MRINGCLVSWQSHLTPQVAHSMMEAEYMAMDEAVKEMVHLTMLLEDLGFAVAKPCGLWSDNARVISLGVNPKLTQRSKHIDLHHHYVQNIVAENQVVLQKVAGQENIADIFTKSLGGDCFGMLRDALVTQIKG